MTMGIWDSVHECPAEALKPILGGKLKGKSDINPMWRYKKLTELFGPAGKGWGVEDDRFTVLEGAGGEKAVMCQLYLWFLDDGEKCRVPGQGGSMLVAMEKEKLVTNDEAYKMAYTDAVSVACKQLGFAADVYWANGADSKYTRNQTDDDPLGTGGTEKRLPPRSGGDTCEACGAKLTDAQRLLAQKAMAEGKASRLLCAACRRKGGGR